VDIPLLPILIALTTTFLAISLLRNFAISIELVDYPNNRKPHTGFVPLIGGISMYIGLVISILASKIDLNQYSYFLLGSLIIVMIGVLDDYRNISVSLRIFFQVIVAIIIVTAGSVVIESLGDLLWVGNVVLNEWAYFVTIIAIIAGMNSVNMTDGIHGLAGGNSLITFLAIVFLSKDLDWHFQTSVLISLLFCAVLPIFLIHNLCLGIDKSKRIFMGDAGSMLIGFTIAWVLIDLSQGENRVFAPVTALWLFATPLIEMVSTVIRRLTSGKSPFYPDLNHTHHIILRLGFREKYTLLLMLLGSLLMAVIGILGELYGVAEWVMFLGFLIVFGIYFFSCETFLKNIQDNGKSSD
jgi:UDP-GlcNAc:undecaprenyl-phosphate/decaprenyl-phosphate GlcNAc-1-phosphate transferase